MSVTDFVLPSLFALSSAGLIWFFYKYGHGAYNNKYVADTLLFLTSLGALFFLPYADAVDSVFLILYAASIFSFRFLILRKHLHIDQLAMHFAISYLTVSRLNKVSGYGSYSDWLDAADYLCFFLVLIFAWSLCWKQMKLAYLAVFLLFVPLSHLPLELARNIWARQLTDEARNVYVTKIESSCVANWLLDLPLGTADTKIICIYGFKSHSIMKLITLDRKERLNPMTGLLDGGGTLGAQGINTWIWERKLYQHLFQHSPSNSSISRI